MTELRLPLNEGQIRTLRAGENIFLSGTILTARDVAHNYLMHNEITELTPLLKNSLVYHCGPIVRELDGEYEFLAAGPTTSLREEPYMSSLIEIGRAHV